MIAIDTNVLLRYLLQDDPVQSPTANRLLGGTRAILVADTVLAETVWVLRGKKYSASKQEVILSIRSLLKEPNIRFESSQVVWQALGQYRRAQGANGKKADFADALILAKSRQVIEVQHNEEFEGWYTFDVGAQTLNGALAP